MEIFLWDGDRVDGSRVIREALEERVCMEGRMDAVGSRAGLRLHQQGLTLPVFLSGFPPLLPNRAACLVGKHNGVRAGVIHWRPCSDW